MYPVDNNKDQCFSLPAFFCLTRVQVEKVAGVAIGCIILFGFQMACSSTTVAKIAFSCSALTLLAEKCLRSENDQKSWFKFSSVDMEAVGKHLTAAFTVQIIAGIVFRVLNIQIFQAVAKLIAQRHMIIIILAIVAAPISEELVFRGFVMERIEDAATLCNRYICKIHPETQKNIANFGQAILFGAVHINAMQSKLANMIIFAGAGLGGFIVGKVKTLNNSILQPMMHHSIHNGALVFRLVLFGH